MDGFGIWSKLSDTLQYVKAEINNSVEQRKHQDCSTIKQTY